MSTVIDVLNGFVNGAASLVGAGEAYDKMGELSSELKSIQQKANSLTSTNSLIFAQDVISGMNALRDINQLTAKQQEILQKNTNTFINDSLQRENLFILFLYLLVYILILFFLIQKNCCKE